MLEKIKKIIAFKQFYDSKIMIDTDDKLPDNITLKNYSILLKSVLKDDCKWYLQMFLKNISNIKDY